MTDEEAEIGRTNRVQPEPRGLKAVNANMLRWLGQS